ncbi:hypothetical protein CVT24_010651 [Panaeolus cyanescens]|uniref:Superoxide dismutase [Cu-Zn] n=1 Tax=Panaeolus cyanescens TaxID=181874 RepID=A0A409YM20_9AGAR|nr:hypothetical protein CVT24_010651 [Panaeolus cyanescens]
MDSAHPYGKPKSPTSVWKVVGATAAALGFVYLLLQTANRNVGSAAPPVSQKAVAVLSGPGTVTGTVLFEQEQPNGKVTVTGKIRGLDPNALRGFHIHKSGDLTNGCISAGPHFNPFEHTHGAPSDVNRHVGDLGNIKTDASGDAEFVIQDKQISLNGLTSIIGRAVVVHGGTDDLGKGHNPESLLTGNAGARVACGVIVATTKMIFSISLFLLFMIQATFTHALCVKPENRTAIAVLAMTGSQVNGTVVFEQLAKSKSVKITGNIQGLTANTQHGFHVHQLGNLTAQCTSAGPHFNPFAQNHGAPTDDVRHVGDLGNIQSDASGNAIFEFTDDVISLRNFKTSIIGRAIVVHADQDDFGKGGHNDSLTTGHAGARVACGIIGVAS